MANNVKISCSESDSQISNRSTNSKDDICRDFLRNVCHRGVGCRFRHPEQHEAKALGKKESVVFCHDYQNKECLRRNCKFVHCTKEEEEYFRSSGHLQSETPICKDYLKGKCRRSKRCKFRHVFSSEHQREFSSEDDIQHYFNRHDEVMEPVAKRRTLNSNYLDPYSPLVDYPEMVRQYYLQLEVENRLLANKVEQLKRQVADLTSTNEFLLDQNAQMRVSKQTLVSNVHSANWSSDQSLVKGDIDRQSAYTW